MGLFSIFKKKSEVERLRDQYQALLKASFELSKTDRTASDQKAAEAHKIAKKIEALEQENN